MTNTGVSPEQDAFLKICPCGMFSRDLAKSRRLAQVALKDEPVVGRLLRRLEGVSQKMPSQTLRSLER